MAGITTERKVELQLDSILEMIDIKEDKHDIDLHDIKNRVGRLAYILHEDIFNQLKEED